MKRFLSIAVCTALFCLIAGCGQKGSLYLPQDPVNDSQSLASDGGSSEKDVPTSSGEEVSYDEQELFDFDSEPAS